MKLTLIEAKVQQTIHKNTATSYGLTLVAGLPFPASITTQIQVVQRQLEALVLGCFAWYSPEQLHVTLFAPLRGRYRDWPPLQREELPTNLEDFVDTLNTFFSQQPPFSLELVGVRITPEGTILITENSLAQQLAVSLQKYPELDSPKYLRGRQIVIGYLNTDPSLMSENEVIRLEQHLLEMTDFPVGQVIIQQAHLTHYANRTLNQIIGKATFHLGQANRITVDQLLKDLGVLTPTP